MKHIIRCIGFSALLCALVSCSFGGKTSSLDDLATLDEEVYHVAAGDTLLVKVWGEPRLSGEVFVREDGRFTLALINDVAAEGKTLEEVAQVITEKLQVYIPAASVSVSVVQEAPIRYYLSGAFVKPGEYRSVGRITFLQAVATGGGFAPFASEGTIILIRRSAQGESRYKFNYNRVISGKQPNPVLRDGDIIAVE